MGAAAKRLASKAGTRARVPAAGCDPRPGRRRIPRRIARTRKRGRIGFPVADPHRGPDRRWWCHGHRAGARPRAAWCRLRPGREVGHQRRRVGAQPRLAPQRRPIRGERPRSGGGVPRRGCDPEAHGRSGDPGHRRLLRRGTGRRRALHRRLPVELRAIRHRRPRRGPCHGTRARAGPCGARDRGVRGAGRVDRSIPAVARDDGRTRSAWARDCCGTRASSTSSGRAGASGPRACGWMPAPTTSASRPHST